jgi:hypothetical protein
MPSIHIGSPAGESSHVLWRRASHSTVMSSRLVSGGREAVATMPRSGRQRGDARPPLRLTLRAPRHGGAQEAGGDSVLMPPSQAAGRDGEQSGDERAMLSLP